MLDHTQSVCEKWNKTNLIEYVVAFLRNSFTACACKIFRKTVDKNREVI